jgi:hypothetical protein
MVSHTSIQGLLLSMVTWIIQLQITELGFAWGVEIFFAWPWKQMNFFISIHNTTKFLYPLEHDRVSFVRDVKDWHFFCLYVYRFAVEQRVNVTSCHGLVAGM